MDQYRRVVWIRKSPSWSTDQLIQTLHDPDHHNFGKLIITEYPSLIEVMIITNQDRDPGQSWLESLVCDYDRDQHPHDLDQYLPHLLQGHRIATAESATAGLLAARLVDQPGSSAYVAGGVVAYSNTIKNALLGVDRHLLDTTGPICPQVAIQMAHGATSLFHADLGMSVTGLAGPHAEGSIPVGTMILGISTPTLSRAYTYRCEGSRNDRRHQATTIALGLLYEYLHSCHDHPPRVS